MSTQKIPQRRVFNTDTGFKSIVNKVKTFNLIAIVQTSLKIVFFAESLLTILDATVDQG